MFCLFLIQVIPKPVLNLMDLSFPLAFSDLGADNLENEFILRNLHLSQVHLNFPMWKFGSGMGKENFITSTAEYICVKLLVD